MSTNTEGKYVSRGGHKLRGAVETFSIPVQGKICADIGCSTGGFTDYLLQSGAQSVWCIDVGYGLLDYTLRKDPRIHLLERTNFRYMDSNVFGDERPSLAVVDVSFISLDKILPKLSECLSADGDAIVLVKPQFEGTPKEVPGGFVKDEPTRQLILDRTRTIVEPSGFILKSFADSVVKGRKGNQETFFHLTKHPRSLNA